MIKILVSNTPKAIFQEEYPYLFGMFFNALFILIVLTPIILVISSLTESYNIAMISFIVLMLFLGGVARFFAVHDPEGMGKNSLAIDIAFGLKHSGEKFFPETKNDLKFQWPSGHNNHRHQGPPPPDKVEDEFWVQLNLVLWILGSLVILFRRLNKIEVSE